MRATLFLRIASVLTFIHAALHTIGGVFGKPAPGEQQAVVDTMRANEFLAMGAMRSYWSFYFGMGLAVSVLLTVESVVFWQLGSLAKRDAPANAADDDDVSVGLSVPGSRVVEVLLCRAGHHGDIDCAVPGVGDLEFASSHSAAVSGVKAGD